MWQIISKAEFPEIEYQRNLCKNVGGLYLAVVIMLYLHIVIWSKIGLLNQILFALESTNYKLQFETKLNSVAQTVQKLW